jgi:hypothetical protein
MALSTHDANREYSSRPADEKFKTIEDLKAAAELAMRSSGEKRLPLAGIEAVTVGENVCLRSKAHDTVAKMTPWAFDQVARTISAPAGYLRKLDPSLAASCINDGLGKLEGEDRTEDKLFYFRKGVDGLTLRALTSTSYSRLHDFKAISEGLDRLRGVRPALDLPPVWEGGKGGAYLGDRDMFCILVDGGSIVNDPTIDFGGSNGTMYRGVILRNSEVGAATVEMLTFLFRGICGNHNIWGVENAVAARRRHVGKVENAFTTMVDVATEFFNRPESEDVNRIKTLASLAMGKDRDETIGNGRKIGLTAEQAETAYDTAEEFEPNPRSVWGYAQGITRMSQVTEYQDDRLVLDLLAAKLMRDRARVAA